MLNTPEKKELSVARAKLRAIRRKSKLSNGKDLVTVFTEILAAVKKHSRVTYQRIPLTAEEEKNRRLSRLEYTKAYRLSPEYKKRRNSQLAARRESDELFRIKHLVRCRILVCFKRNGLNKSAKTYEILGCSFEQLKDHLESLFTEGMTWENMGEWHIDHKIPLALAKTPEAIIKLNHYTNLQPLWRIDNLKKGARL